MSATTDIVDATLAVLPRLFGQPALAVYGIVLIALVPLGLLWSYLDVRTVKGESAATKPTRFLLSIGMHTITLSWMINFVHPERVHAFAPCSQSGSSWSARLGS